MNTLTLYQALEAFILDKQAAGMSKYTIRNYRNTVKKVQLYWPEDRPLVEISRSDWVGFMAWLQNEHISSPGGVAARPSKRLKPKSIANIHTDLSSFYSWATSPGVEIVNDHVFSTIDAPRFEPPQVETISKDDFKKLLAACGGERKRPTRLRDRAILHILLSTGVRASELCAVRIEDLDLGARSVWVAGKGRGRDSKPRIVYFGKTAHRALWLYLAPRLQESRPSDHVFVVDENNLPRPMTRDVLYHLIAGIGRRAGIKAYPHLFRHTFATEFLRNGGDILKLQRILGHTSLEMVRRYAHLVAADCQAAHEAADPADNWRVR